MTISMSLTAQNPWTASHIDYRRPEDSEELLKNLPDIDGNTVIGFFDESSPQTGFYALNGNSVIDFKENSKTESVCDFLGKIIFENSDWKSAIILDNFRSHRAITTMEFAKNIDIELIYLPPYSYIWIRLNTSVKASKGLFHRIIFNMLST